MKTQVNVYDHAAGLRDSITVPLSRDVTVNRLRQAIGEPQFELYEDVADVYARIDVEPITVHVFSFSAHAAAGEWNRIVSILQTIRRVVT